MKIFESQSLASLSKALAPYPNLLKIVEAVLVYWPEHESFLLMRFAEAYRETFDVSEEVARLTLATMHEDLQLYVEGYRWICETFVTEDLAFRRTGRYRLSRFEEADAEVYARPEYMTNYLKGIILSQCLWANQAISFSFYIESFLKRIPQSKTHLEIGPGHGLLMHFASRFLPNAELVGWDASESSIAMTDHTLSILGSGRPYRLESRNILEPQNVADAFDSVVMSEVLEHLERPEVALQAVRRLLKDNGLAFFNIPLNSPAPDHIYLWRSTEEVENDIRSNGFTIVASHAVPSTGYDLERARRRSVTINSLIIAKRAAAHTEAF